MEKIVIEMGPWPQYDPSHVIGNQVNEIYWSGSVYIFAISPM